MRTFTANCYYGVPKVGDLYCCRMPGGQRSVLDRCSLRLAVNDTWPLHRPDDEYSLRIRTSADHRVCKAEVYNRQSFGIFPTGKRWILSSAIYRRAAPVPHEAIFERQASLPEPCAIWTTAPYFGDNYIRVSNPSATRSLNHIWCVNLLTAALFRISTDWACSHCFCLVDQHLFE